MAKKLSKKLEAIGAKLTDYAENETTQFSEKVVNKLYSITDSVFTLADKVDREETKIKEEGK